MGGYSPTAPAGADWLLSRVPGVRAERSPLANLPRLLWSRGTSENSVVVFHKFQAVDATLQQVPQNLTVL